MWHATRANENRYTTVSRLTFSSVCFHEIPIICQEKSMSISVKQARTLCSPSELSLVLDSSAKSVKQLSAAELQSRITRTRTLRDKWRDQFERQKRSTKKKATGAEAEANARSEVKMQLYSETLDRYTKQLPIATSAAATAPQGSAPKRAKRVTVNHREKRAQVRKELLGAKKTLNRKAKQAPSVQVSKAEAPQPPTKTKTPKKPTPKKKGATAKPMASVKTTSTTTTPLSKKVPTKPGVRTLEAAKSSAFMRGGVKRIQAHTSSQGKRSQARRDSKR